MATGNCNRAQVPADCDQKLYQKLIIISLSLAALAYASSPFLFVSLSFPLPLCVTFALVSLWHAVFICSQLYFYFYIQFLATDLPQHKRRVIVV